MVAHRPGRKRLAEARAETVGPAREGGERHLPRRCTTHAVSWARSARAKLPIEVLLPSSTSRMPSRRIKELRDSVDVAAAVIRYEEANRHRSSVISAAQARVAALGQGDDQQLTQHSPARRPRFRRAPGYRC